MTGRDPMFGRKRGRTPFSQVGPSQERAEREDETGVSAHRTTLTVGHLDREGAAGLTIHELSDRTGWHHGQASQVLSTLDVVGRKQVKDWADTDVVRLNERRGNQSVYVLVQHLLGRPVAERRESRAGRLQQELDEASATIEVLKEENRRLIDEGDRLRAGLREALEQMANAESSLARLQEEVRQARGRFGAEQETLRDDRDRAYEQVRLAGEHVDRLQAELDERTREVSALLVQRHLITTLEPDEREVFDRIRALLDNPTVQGWLDDRTAPVAVGVLRTFVRIVSRLLPPQESAPQASPPDGPTAP